MPYMKTTDHNDHIHDETNINQNHANQQPKGNCEASKGANHHTTKESPDQSLDPFQFLSAAPNTQSNGRLHMPHAWSKSLGTDQSASKSSHEESESFHYFKFRDFQTESRK